MYAYGSHGNDYGWYVASKYDLKIRYEQSYKKYYPVQVKAGVQTLDIENNSTYNAGSYDGKRQCKLCYISCTQL